MIWFTVIWTFLLFTWSSGQDRLHYNARGEPIASGIERYIFVNEERFAEEFMDLVQDSLHEYSITADNLSLYMQYDPLEMGRYYYPHEIIITNEEKYIDYAVDSLTLSERNFTVSNKFVKGCVYHELTHLWIQQIMREMRYLNRFVSPEYRNFRVYHEANRGFGAEFIEEGICEYIAHMAGEILYPETAAPDLKTDWNSFDIKYLYAEYYVRQILEPGENLKEGIMNILTAPPPTSAEIRNPELFYRRVMEGGHH